jgi:hypothetical protein
MSSSYCGICSTFAKNAWTAASSQSSRDTVGDEATVGEAAIVGIRPAVKNVHEM